MNMARLLLIALLCLTGCGVFYWESPGRDVSAFKDDSGACIKDATIKYDVASERIYRACMKSRGWQRTQTGGPGDTQFRGPEGDDGFSAPPDPMSERLRTRADDLACARPTASRPVGLVCPSR